MAYPSGHNHKNEIEQLIDKRKLDYQEDSDAADVDELRADFNDLLAKLQDAKLMKTE